MKEAMAKTAIPRRSTFESVRQLVSPAIGKDCCTIRVGSSRSLALGFGERVYHSNSKLPYKFYGEWELRTYNAAWRVVAGDSSIICGSGDTVEQMGQLELRLGASGLGRWVDVQMTSKFDLLLQLSNSISVHFLGATADDDELFHIRCPDSLVAQYKVAQGWRIGRSDVAWTSSDP